MPDLFNGLNYKQYCIDEGIHELFGIDLEKYGVVDAKQKQDLWDTVNPDNRVPFPPELDDLIRLHYLTRSRNAVTVMEFGSGKSTKVFTDALLKNKHSNIARHIRRSTPYELHTVDASSEWIKETKNFLTQEEKVITTFYYSEVTMTLFNGRICTMYDIIPNVCPDIIYLDGPDQFNVKHHVRGITTAMPDRMPMSADILAIEHFLLPGTLIVVDGRTANARFIKCNLQREWEYCHWYDEDIHTFELIEKPLGIHNKKQLKLCLGR